MTSTAVVECPRWRGKALCEPNTVRPAPVPFRWAVRPPDEVPHLVALRRDLSEGEQLRRYFAALPAPFNTFWPIEKD